MADNDNIINPADGDDGGINDFSWEIMNEDAMQGDITSLTQEVYQASKKVQEMYTHNEYLPVYKALNELCRYQLGRGGPIQQYYYSNHDYFAPYMKSDAKPSDYHDMSPDKQKRFTKNVNWMRDAAWCIKPLDQLTMLVNGIPLFSSFKITQATSNLDDSGFDKDFYDEINDVCKEVSDLINHNWTWMKNTTDRESYRLFKEHYEDMELTKLNEEYRKARLRDYKLTLEVYAPKTSKNFKSNDFCMIYPDLQFLACMMVIDEYMEVIAKALKNDIVSNLERSLEDSKKLRVVINSRIEKCTTDQFNMVLTAIDTLNNELYDFCEYSLNVAKNYKNKILAEPYCYMTKPPASESIQSKYGFAPMGGDPLSDGTKYKDLISKAGSALSQHCRDYVYNHGEEKLMF
ncbi:MAG: hypothetical protein J6X19_02530 [Clostridia bacterium]|nr:hypothetical protein [Clostridia bacterium]